MKKIILPPMSTINWSTQAYGINVPMSERVCRDYHINDACWHLRKKNSGKKGAFLNNNEYQMLLALADTPGIPAVYGLYYEQHVSVLVREYIQGNTLSVLLRRKTLSLQEKTHCLSALASVISLCHRKGVIHADLKANNIVVGKHGLSLIDFGAAGRLGSDISEKPYLSYTRSFSHPNLSTGSGEYTPALDWYSYLIICYVVTFNTLPQKHSDHATKHHEVSDESVHLYYDFSRLFDPALIPAALLSVLHDVNKILLHKPQCPTTEFPTTSRLNA
ncbi:protein kinase [Thalassomonas sp. RHCl1]|uniref:protein kinase domain-containing protein n=1 Tax=Thalassomonas sp. RHCl1 TaxID=2995320 RepID=UPI00248B09D9|nr:protein kinase [Thalassomonas sp. RHCl1]